jgi:membrane protease subunit (stomatin/prohibitin family)
VTSGAYTEEIEADVLLKVDHHVADYGLDIVRLGTFVIGIDEEDADNLKTLYRDAAYLRTVGGVDGYQRFAAGKAMMGAGEGMALGGGAGGGEGNSGMLGGAGMGIGFGLAQMMVRDNRGGETLAPAAAGVICGSCSSSVPAGKFCSACGEALQKVTPGSRHCTSCGEVLAADARFCGSCGTRQGD